MKKITSVLAAAMLMVGTAVVPTAPAVAQAPGTVTCEAASGYAIGVWTAYNGDYACRRAVRECQIRTPYYGTCYVTRWWVN